MTALESNDCRSVLLLANENGVIGYAGRGGEAPGPGAWSLAECVKLGWVRYIGTTYPEGCADRKPGHDPEDDWPIPKAADGRPFRSRYELTAAGRIALDAIKAGA